MLREQGIFTFKEEMKLSEEQRKGYFEKDKSLFINAGKYIKDSWQSVFKNA